MPWTLLAIGMLMLSGNGCKKAPVLDCFVSTGKITMEERQVGQFSAIQVNDNINLILRQSSANRLVVEAGSNLMGSIVTQVENDSLLVLRNDMACNWVRSYDKPVNVYLDFKRLDILEYRSIGDVSNESTLHLDSLHIELREGAGNIMLNLHTPLLFCNLHYGTADIRLNGEVDVCYVYGDGFGRIDNRDLVVSQVYVTNRSSNDIFLQATLRLGATIENIGNIYYRGDPPEIELQRTGSGQLIRMD